jgi:hypothetical protein
LSLAAFPILIIPIKSTSRRELHGDRHVTILAQV